ncbi:hypothetical protein XENTR_v10002861 [Xenopus tropicalis]|nr:hypothetical protein XENTR_v10002861 [Xenopus tropicalis]
METHRFLLFLIFFIIFLIHSTAYPTTESTLNNDEDDDAYIDEVTTVENSFAQIETDEERTNKKRKENITPVDEGDDEVKCIPDEPGKI